MIQAWKDQCFTVQGKPTLPLIFFSLWFCIDVHSLLGATSALDPPASGSTLPTLPLTFPGLRLCTNVHSILNGNKRTGPASLGP